MQGKLGLGPLQALHAPSTSREVLEHLAHLRKISRARQLLGRFTHWLFMNTCPWLQLIGLSTHTPLRRVRPAEQLGVGMHPPLRTQQLLLQRVQVAEVKLQSWQLLVLEYCVHCPLTSTKPVMQLLQSSLAMLKLRQVLGMGVQLASLTEQQELKPQSTGRHLPAERQQAGVRQVRQLPLAGLKVLQVLLMQRLLKRKKPGLQQLVLLTHWLLMSCSCPRQLQQLPVQGSNWSQLALTGQHLPKLKYSRGPQLVLMVQAPRDREYPGMQAVHICALQSYTKQGRPLPVEIMLGREQPGKTVQASAKLLLYGHGQASDCVLIVMAGATPSVRTTTAQQPALSSVMQVATPFWMVVGERSVAVATRRLVAVEGSMARRVKQVEGVGLGVMVRVRLQGLAMQKYLMMCCLRTSATLRMAWLLAEAKRQYMTMLLSWVLGLTDATFRQQVEPSVTFQERQHAVPPLHLLGEESSKVTTVALVLLSTIERRTVEEVRMAPPKGSCMVMERVVSLERQPRRQEGCWQVLVGEVGKVQGQVERVLAKAASKSNIAAVFIILLGQLQLSAASKAR